MLKLKRHVMLVSQLRWSLHLEVLALVAVSALVGAGAMYVSLGNKTTEETTLVSMKGDTVTVSDVFDSLKVAAKHNKVF